MNTSNKRTDVFWVFPSQILVKEGFNKRIDYGDIDSLAKSIHANGIQQPLIVQKERGTENYYVISGHRRERALRLALEMGLDKHTLIPVIKEFSGVSEQQRLLNQYIHNDGLQFTLLEKADLFKDAIDNHGMTPKQIGKELGVSTSHVSDCLKLTTISEKLRNQIISGKVAATLIIDEMKKKKSDEVEGEIDEAVSNAKDGKKVTKKDLKDGGAGPSAGAKDKKVAISDLESLYNDVNTALAGKGDPDKMAIFKMLTELLRGSSDFDAFLEFFKPAKKKA